jgi:hypothetical protein
LNVNGQFQRGKLNNVLQMRQKCAANVHPKNFFLGMLIFHLSWVGAYGTDISEPSDPGPDDVSDEPPFRSLQFTALEVLNAL